MITRLNRITLVEPQVTSSHSVYLSRLVLFLFLRLLVPLVPVLPSLDLVLYNRGFANFLSRKKKSWEEFIAACKFVTIMAFLGQHTLQLMVLKETAGKKVPPSVQVKGIVDPRWVLRITEDLALLKETLVANAEKAERRDGRHRTEKETQIEILGTKVDLAETWVETIQTDINSVTSNVETVESNVKLDMGELNKDIRIMQAYIKSVRSKVETVDTNVEAVVTDIISVRSKVETVESNIKLNMGGGSNHASRYQISEMQIGDRGTITG